MQPLLQQNDLLKRALEKFRENTGLQVKIDALEPATPGVNPHYRPDARIIFTHEGKDVAYWVEIKKQVDRFAALTAFKQLAAHGGGILVTEYLTPNLIEHCKQNRLPFLDTAGNAYLNERGLFVLIQGKTLAGTELRKGAPTRAFQRAGLKVVFALLTHPPLLQATYREIAKAAGVALGAVGRVLGDLQDRGLLVEDRGGIRRWIDQEQAIQTWVTNYPMRLRNHLTPKRYRAADENWWKRVDPTLHGGCWGGEIAAAKLQGELNPKTATLYIRGDRNPFLTAHRLKAADDGPIEVLDAFWDIQEDSNLMKGIVPPLLVFADLQDLGDPRTYEQAKRIHDHYLA